MHSQSVTFPVPRPGTVIGLVAPNATVTMAGLSLTI